MFEQEGADREERSNDDSEANRETTETDQHSTDRVADRYQSFEGVQRSQSGVSETSEQEESASLGAGTVTYDPGPDRARLSDRYGMAVYDGEGRKLQRLENEFGETRVQRWADEGMTVRTMGKPQDMQTFRQRQEGRPEAVPTDIERRNEASAQRSADAARDDGPAGDGGAPDSVRDVVSSPGRSMDESVQREMEDKMGGSFEDVQLHTGPKAAEAADSINARAFTVGNHVAFNSGEYNPDSDSGKKVLAHELTHVRQQTDGRVSLLPKAGVEHPGIDPAEGGVIQRRGHEMIVQPKLEVSSPNDPAEREAERVAEQVMEMDEASGAAGTEAQKSPDVQQRGVGRVVQREATEDEAELPWCSVEDEEEETDSDEEDRYPPEQLEPSDEIKEFIKTREGLPQVGGPFEGKIPDEDHEGNELVYEHDIAPYDDGEKAGDGYATIGWGHLIHGRQTCNKLREEGLMPEEYNLGITRSDAEELFEEDVEEHAEPVREAIDVDLTQTEFDALTSFTFNLGRGHMNAETEENSSVLTAVNDKDPEAVVEAFELYEGSIDRRMHEAAIFVHGRYDVRHDEYEALQEYIESDAYAVTSLAKEGTTSLSGLAANYENVSWRDIQEFNREAENSWDGDPSMQSEDAVIVPLDTAESENESTPDEQDDGESEEAVESGAETGSSEEEAGGSGGSWVDPLDDMSTLQAASRWTDASNALFGDVRNGGERGHDGIDYYAETGASTYAVMDGRVHNLNMSGYGDSILLYEGDSLDAGSTFLYAHLQGYSAEDWSRVTAGEEIGQVGVSGNAVSDRPHLHFEVHPSGWRGAADPLNNGFPTPDEQRVYDADEGWYTDDFDITASELYAGAETDGDEPDEVEDASTDSSGNATYTVQGGDTLGSIADQFDVPGGWRALYEANQNVLDDPDVISPGIPLRIPGQDGEILEATEGTVVEGDAAESESEAESEAAVGEQDENSDSGFFGGLRESVEEGFESTAETIGEGVSWAADRLGGFFGAAEENANEDEIEDGEEDTGDMITEVIEGETNAYNSLEVTLENGETVEVEATYFMNSDKRRGIHDNRVEGDESWETAIFAEGSEEQQVRDSVTGGHAVEYGKASPSDLEVFIQEAYNQGAVENYVRTNPPDEDTEQAKIQHWINQVGIGVDCSGFVAHMLTQIRGEKVDDEDFDEGDLPASTRNREGDRLAEEGEVTVSNRGAADFNLHEGRNAEYVEDEVADEYKRETIEELRPGDVGIKGSLGHVVMVAEITHDDGEYEVKTAESGSRGSRDEEGVQERTFTVEELDNLKDGYSWYGVAAIDF